MSCQILPALPDWALFKLMLDVNILDHLCNMNLGFRSTCKASYDVFAGDIFFSSENREIKADVFLFSLLGGSNAYL